MDITVYGIIREYWEWGPIPWTFKKKDSAFYKFINCSQIKVVAIYERYL